MSNMSNFSLKENLQSFGLGMALDIIRHNPEKNLRKLMKCIDFLDRNDDLIAAREVAWDVIDNPDNIWNKFVMDLWEDIDDDVRCTFFENFIVNSAIIGFQRQHEYQDKYHCNIPWAILMDPTSACNLSCTGCWTAEYGNQLI